MSKSFYASYLLLPSKGKRQINDVVSDLNSQYVQGIKKAKAILSKPKTSYIDELWEPIYHIHWIWDYSHNYDGKLNAPYSPQWNLWYPFEPNSAIMEWIYSALHFLNESLKGQKLEDLADYVQTCLHGTKDIPNITLSNTELKKTRKFILLLPNKIQTTNIESLKLFCEKSQIQKLGYNANGAITQEHFTQIGGRNKYCSVVAKR